MGGKGTLACSWLPYEDPVISPVQLMGNRSDQPRPVPQLDIHRDHPGQCEGLAEQHKCRRFALDRKKQAITPSGDVRSIVRPIIQSPGRAK